MIPVAIIAANALRWEPRAAQQAVSLAGHGYAVTMYGIRDWGGTCDAPFELPGVSVVLVSSRVLASAIAATAFVALALILAWVATAAGSNTVPAAVRVSWVAGIAAAASLAAAMLMFVQGYLETAAMDRSTAARPLVRSLRPVMGMRPVGRIVSFLRRRFYWPLLETVNAWLIAAHVVRHNPAVVHCHDIYTLRIGAAIKRRTGAALIYDAHEIYEGMARRSRHDAVRYGNMLSRHGPMLDGFIVPNSKNGEYYSTHYDGLPSPVVIPNAKRANFDLAYDWRLHDAAGLPRETRILLYAGSLIAERGLEALVDAAYQLPQGWAVVLMGRGDLLSRLEDVRLEKESARALSNEPDFPCARILPPAPMAELPEWICGAAVGMIPHERTCLNHDQCSPHKLWDYASVGVPMLATDLPLIAEAVNGAGMGWIISAGADAGEVADAIARLSEADMERARAGCRRFMEMEDWSIYERDLLDLYGAVLKRDGNHRMEPVG